MIWNPWKRIAQMEADGVSVARKVSTDAATTERARCIAIVEQRRKDIQKTRSQFAGRKAWHIQECDTILELLTKD